MSRTTGCLIVDCAWLAIAGTARPAWAQQPRPTRSRTMSTRSAGANEAEVVEVQGENVEQWIFAGLGAAGARKRLEEYLTRDIARYDRNYGLTPAQKKKLELAGRHDIKRFFDRVEDAKAEYRRVKGDWNKVGTRIFELQRIQNQPHLELFGDESMLAKTLKKIADPRADRRARSDHLSGAGGVDGRVPRQAAEPERRAAPAARGPGGRRRRRR